MSETNGWIKKSVKPPPVGVTVHIGWRMSDGEPVFGKGWMNSSGSTSTTKGQWIKLGFDYYWRPIDTDPPLPEE